MTWLRSTLPLLVAYVSLMGSCLSSSSSLETWEGGREGEREGGREGEREGGREGGRGRERERVTHYTSCMHYMSSTYLNTIFIKLIETWPAHHQIS